MAHQEAEHEQPKQERELSTQNALDYELARHIKAAEAAGLVLGGDLLKGIRKQVAALVESGQIVPLEREPEAPKLKRETLIQKEGMSLTLRGNAGRDVRLWYAPNDADNGVVLKAAFPFAAHARLVGDGEAATFQSLGKRPIWYTVIAEGDLAEACRGIEQGQHLQEITGRKGTWVYEAQNKQGQPETRTEKNALFAERIVLGPKPLRPRRG